MLRVKRRVFRLLAAWPGVLWRLGGSAPPPPPAVQREDQLIAVSLRRRRLYLYEHGRLQSSYHIGIGGWRARTPRGSFRIQLKIRDPDWLVPDVAARYGELAGRNIRSGDPRNRLGPCWLQLHNGIGIHAKRPGPLGIGATDGCLALAPENAIELFDRVQTGTPVIIQ